MSDIVNAQLGEACSVASDAAFGWSSIDWKRVEQNVRRLQIRIAKATLQGTFAPPFASGAVRTIGASI
jgi:hypothetical protein